MENQTPQTPNNNSNNNKEAKQQYLINNIKEQDREAFADFISFMRNDGHNLENWTYDELKQVVSEFLGKVNEENKVKQEIINLQPNYVNNLQPGGDNWERHPAKKLPKVLLTDFSNLTITIKNPEIIETNILASNYVLYEIFTDPIKYTVKRRYSDFEKLREILIKMFFGISIPPLPHKKVGSRRFEEDYINKRMYLLSLFLQSIIDNPVLRCSEIVTNFLTTRDRNIFEKKVSEFNAIKPPHVLEECYSISGEHFLSFDNINKLNEPKNTNLVSNSEITNSLVNVTNKITNNSKASVNNASTIKESINMYTKILKETNSLFKEYDNCIKKAYLQLDAIQAKFEQLSILSMRIGVTENSSLLFIEGKNFFNKYKKIIYSQKTTINKYFKEQLKYNRMNYESFVKENIKEYEEINSKFIMKMQSY